VHPALADALGLHAPLVAHRHLERLEPRVVKRAELPVRFVIHVYIHNEAVRRAYPAKGRLEVRLQRRSDRIDLLIWHDPDGDTRPHRARDDSRVCGARQRGPHTPARVYVLFGPDTSILCTVSAGSLHRAARSDAGRCVMPESTR
jgi:hypothetical protein